jgi:hypothetical protein
MPPYLSLRNPHRAGAGVPPMSPTPITLPDIPPHPAPKAQSPQPRAKSLDNSAPTPTPTTIRPKSKNKRKGSALPGI